VLSGGLVSVTAVPSESMAPSVHRGDFMLVGLGFGVLGIRGGVVSVMAVPSESMAPSVHRGDFMLVGLDF
jgi:signal peptidase I